MFTGFGTGPKTVLGELGHLLIAGIGPVDVISQVCFVDETHRWQVPQFRGVGNDFFQGGQGRRFRCIDHINDAMGTTQIGFVVVFLLKSSDVPK